MDRYKQGVHWLGKFVPYLIYRISNQLNQRLRKSLRKSGINLARWRVMSVLKDKSPLNMGEIVAATIIEQPTVSRIVDQLEREGLALRKAGDEDSRYVEVMLTEEGEKAFARVYPLAIRHQERALQGFTPEDIEVLTGLLKRILKNIEAEV